MQLQFGHRAEALTALNESVITRLRHRAAATIPAISLVHGQCVNAALRLSSCIQRFESR